MSCVDVSTPMATLLEKLRLWPEVDLDRLREMPEWDEACMWGWIMESGELTGTGLAHAQELPRGMVSE